VVISDLVVEDIQERVELKFVMTTNGAQCVMICGQTLMVMWPANSLDTPQLVHEYAQIFN